MIGEDNFFTVLDIDGTRTALQCAPTLFVPHPGDATHVVGGSDSDAIMVPAQECREL